MSRKSDQAINTQKCGSMDTWNTGGSLKKPSSGWELGPAFPQQQNLDPRKAANQNQQNHGQDPRLAAAMSVAVDPRMPALDPRLAAVFAQSMQTFNPSDMGQLYAYQMGMMAMQAAQVQAQQLNPQQILLPQAMEMSMHQRPAQTKANLTYGEYKKLKDPTYRPEDAWNPEPHQVGTIGENWDKPTDPRLQHQQSIDSVVSVNSAHSVCSVIGGEDWDTPKRSREEEWDRPKKITRTERYSEEKHDENSRRNSNPIAPKQNYRDKNWEDAPLSPANNRSPSPNRSISPRKPYYHQNYQNQQNREPSSAESKNYDEDFSPKSKDYSKNNFDRQFQRGRGRSRGRGWVNYKNNNYNNNGRNNYNGRNNQKFEEDYQDHRKNRRQESPPNRVQRQNSYGSRRSHQDQENYDDRRRSRHDEYSPERRRSDQDRHHQDRYNKYDRKDDRREHYNRGPRSPREPRTPSQEVNGEDHRRKSRSLNRDRREPELNPPLPRDEMEVEENGNKNGSGRDSRNERYGPKRREGSVTSRRSNESTGSFNRQPQMSSSSSRYSLENGSRERYSKHPDKNGRSSRNGRPESPRDRPKSPVDPPREPTRDKSYSVSPPPLKRLSKEFNTPNGTNERPKSPPALPMNWLYEKNRRRPKSPEYSRCFDKSESRSQSPVNHKNSRFESPRRSERSDQRHVRSRSPIEKRRDFITRSTSQAKACGPKSPPESPSRDRSQPEIEVHKVKIQATFEDSSNDEKKSAYRTQRRSRFSIPDYFERNQKIEASVANSETTKKNKMEVPIEESISSDSNNWDDDNFQGTAVVDKDPKISSEKIVGLCDWDDENFQGTADLSAFKEDEKKDAVEEKKFKVEAFKTIPETESWDDEDFKGTVLEAPLPQPVFNFKPITIKKDALQFPKPPATNSPKPPEPSEDPEDYPLEPVKLDISVPPPKLPEDDAAEPLPPGVEFEEEYQPLVYNKKKRTVVQVLPELPELFALPVKVFNEPLPPGVEEEEILKILTPLQKLKKVSRKKRKFTDSPEFEQFEHPRLKKILDNLEVQQNIERAALAGHDKETLQMQDSLNSLEKLKKEHPVKTEFDSPASPDQEPLADDEEKKDLEPNILAFQHILEKIEQEHLYPKKPELESPASPDMVPESPGSQLDHEKKIQEPEIVEIVKIEEKERVMPILKAIKEEPRTSVQDLEATTSSTPYTHQVRECSVVLVNIDDDSEEEVNYAPLPPSRRMSSEVIEVFSSLEASDVESE